MGLQGPLMGEHTKVLEVVCPELKPVYTKLVTISKTVYLHSVHPSSKLPNPEEGLWDPPLPIHSPSVRSTGDNL